MIVGHSRNVRYFERVLASGTLAHAYLFHGPEGVGKRTFALALARSLFCKEKPEHLGGCRACEGCRLTDESRHPDLIVLSADSPLVPDEGRGIGIKNIHELIRRLSLSSWRGGRKVVLVDGADALSRDAQPALLKLVEEPDAKTVFFFVTASPDLLLPTIRSRSVAVSFTAVGEDDLRPFVGTAPSARPVRGESPEATAELGVRTSNGARQRLLLALAQGRPGVLMRLAADKEFFEEFQDREGAYPKILDADLAQQFDFSEKASREPDVFESFLAHLIRRKRSELHDALAAPDPREPFAAGVFLASVLEKLSLARGTNVNRRLVLDSIFVELALPSFAEQNSGGRATAEPGAL